MSLEQSRRNLQFWEFMLHNPQDDQIGYSRSSQILYFALDCEEDSENYKIHPHHLQRVHYFQND